MAFTTWLQSIKEPRGGTLGVSSMNLFVTVLLASNAFASYTGGHESHNTGLSFLDACAQDKASIVMNNLGDSNFEPGSESAKCLMKAAKSNGHHVIERIFNTLPASHRLAEAVLYECIRRHNKSAIEAILGYTKINFTEVQLFEALELAIEADNLPIFQLVASQPAMKSKVYNSAQGLEIASSHLRADIVEHILANLVPTDNAWYFLGMAKSDIGFGSVETDLDRSKAERIEQALEMYNINQ